VPIYLVFLVALAANQQPRSLLGFGITLLVLVLATILLFNLLYYGDPMPNTYYLKATGSPVRLVLRSGLTETWPRQKWTALVLALTALGFIRFLRRDHRARLIAATVIILFLYNIAVGGDWISQLIPSRFLAPALPLCTVLFALVWWRALEAAGDLRWA